MSGTKINHWPASRVSGAKRANLVASDMEDWFVGQGKEEECYFEGTWWDMICFARNVLASENTRLAAPEFYMPQLKNRNYTGPTPYEYMTEGE